MRKKYRQVEDKLLYDITDKGEHQQYLVHKKDGLDLEVDGSDLWIKVTSGEFYLTDNSATDYIRMGWIEEVKEDKS